MNLRLYCGAALREARGARGRLVFFTACLALGVAAVVGVASLRSAIENGVRTQSRELVGADLQIESTRAFSSELMAFIGAIPEARHIDVRQLATMASAPSSGRSRLVELKATSAGYPFYGRVELEPVGTLDEVLTEDRVAVAPEVLTDLASKVGDKLSLGGAEFTIAAVVRDEPGRLGFAFTLGPRVFTTIAGLERTKLGGFGARVRHQALVRLPDDLARGELRTIEQRLRESVPGSDYLTIQSREEAQPAVKRSLERVDSYLSLAALLSLVLGGVGVAQIVRAWLSARTAHIAILRCIGFRPREILALYLGNIALLALVGSLLGALAGSLIPLGLGGLLSDVLPRDFPIAWEPWPIARGVVLGLGVALVFSVPPLTAIWRVPPARALRAEAEPLAASRRVTWIAFAVLTLGVLGAAWLQSRSIVLAGWFTGGVALVAGVLTLGARGLTVLAARLPRERANPYLVHGLAALARPSAGTTGAVVALGLGVLVVLSMALVEGRLASRLRSALPADAPSVFLVDVQAGQWDTARAILEQNGARRVDHVPVVTARLSKVGPFDVGNEKLIADLTDDTGRRGWMLTREQRITWMQALPSDNRITAGQLWSDPEHFEVSLEEGFARDIGARVGWTLTFDVQGLPVELLVTSLRTVEWESFGINFFLVAEPGALDRAPHTILVAGRVEASAETPLQDTLAKELPNVTLFRVRPILEKVFNVLARLALGVRLLGSFTILTGIAILCGVVSSGALRRGREVALLKTLGLKRAQVATLFGIEFAFVGLSAGAIGASAAFAISWVFLERATQVPADLPWWPPFAAALATAVLSAVCGLAASARSLAARPIESLRR